MRAWESWCGALAVGVLAAGCAKRNEASSPRGAEDPPPLTPAAGEDARELAPAPNAATPAPGDCAAEPVEEGAVTSCFPPRLFVESLCRGKYPDLALTMFRETAPWKHAWVKVPEVMPQNPYDGPVTHAPLLFSEEVVLLRFRPFQPIRGYSVTGPDRYDVLRLSGSCATLAVDEIRYRWAGPSRYAPLVWNWLEPGFQQALGGAEEVEQARSAQQQACAGRYLGGGDASCQQATDALAHAIMQVVDAGLVLPRPDELPAWAAD